MAIPTPEPRIARFERMGYGIFIHWGLYAHLGQGEWVQHLRKVPMDEYARIKYTFTAEEFDGRQIAAIAKAAGMQYITLTSATTPASRSTTPEVSPTTMRHPRPPAATWSPS